MKSEPWQCPLCGGPLTGEQNLKCPSGHCFDRAREGYWHLLPVQSMRTKAPGDSKEMVAARRAFLNAGYYGIFGQAVGELCLEYGLPAGPETPCTCWMQAAARAGTTAASPGSLMRPGGRWSWRGSTSPNRQSGWRQRRCPRPAMRWHPALPSRSAPDGPTCC